MSNPTSARVSAGVPTGGQFARSSHSESADLELDTDEPVVPAAPPKRSPPPVFTAPTADITAFDPAARAALIASLAPKSVLNEGGYSVTVGAKYDGFQPAAAIAKQVRADLKAAQTSRALPDGVTYTVHSDSFAGGQAVRITAMGLPNSATTVPDNGEWNARRRTTEAAELDQTLMAIGQAYGRSQSGMDLHNGTYYCQTTFEDEHGRMFRQFEKAEKPIQTAWQREGAGTPNWPNTVRGTELTGQRQELLTARDAYRAAHPQRGYDY